MREAGLEYEAVDDDTKHELMGQLRAVAIATRTFGQAPAEADREAVRETYYRVPFAQAAELVSRRAVLLRGGDAFVPRRRLVATVVGRFKARLARALQFAARSLPGVLQDERLGALLTNMSKAYVGPDLAMATQAATGGERVTAADVDRVAAESFPLCMRAAHGALRRHHKLKHDARLQYGLFLKGIGMSLEESLHFWQHEFTRTMTPDEFLKRYAYNVRHSYGKEGKRQDYSPFSCARIITAAGPGPEPESAHGCPYKHWKPEAVRQMLQASSGLQGAAVEHVMEAVQSKDF